MIEPTPSTVRPQFIDPATSPDPFEAKDDRHPGVHLLEFDEAEGAKTTAELIDRRYWKIADWELLNLLGDDGAWVARSWYCVGVDTLETLTQLQAIELAQPPAEQGALNLDPQA